MSAPVVDCTTGPARVRFDDHSAAMLRTIKAVRGFSTVTAAAQWAAEVAYMALQDAPEVETGTPPPLSPEDGREGSGEPPASLPSVNELTSIAGGRPVDGVACTQVDPPHQGASWWLYPTTDAAPAPMAFGDACCDDHIPDGWVKPGLAEAKRLHPSSRPAVEYVDACVYCGERSAHGRCS